MLNRRTDEGAVWGSDETFRAAHQILYRLAGLQPTIHSDDFHAELVERNIHLPPGVIGRIWKTAVDNKIISFSGEMRKSTRSQAHRRRMPVWRSEIYVAPRKTGRLKRLWARFVN